MCGLLLALTDYTAVDNPRVGIFLLATRKEGTTFFDF